jgi:Tectonin domain
MSRRSVCLSVFFALICWGAVAVPASAQHFQQVTGSLTQVAAGRAEVWGLNGSQIYRFNPSTQKFGKIAGSLSQIAVGGGTLLQADEVWGVNASGGIYRFNFSSKAFVNVPGILSHIVVGEGNEDSCRPYEVWGINPVLNVYRYNYCSSQWDQVTIPNPFTVLATGGGDVWGLDEYAQIWHYNFQTQGWNQVTNGGYFGTLQQIAVGVNDVWGLDGNGTIYRYDPTYNQFNTVYSGAAILTQVAAGGNGAWVTYKYGTESGLIARFDSQIEAFYIEGGLYPQFAAQIAVGSGAGVWAVSTSGHVFTFVRP